ncbi:MAG: AAA family ATPase [Bacillota bacterium]
MRLTEFETDYFAGLRDLKIKFHPGLNILLGANEAGKSTVVDAVYAVLFKSSKLRMNLKEDREFKEKYMPLNKSNYINSIISFNYYDRNFTLQKEWGDKSEAQLLEVDGEKIVDEASIQDKIFDIFSFGRKTAKNIIFTGQENMKNMIEEIKENPQVNSTLNGFLRRAVMELDGISVEKFKSKVEENLDDFIKRWNLSEKRPENPNRGVDNPYLIGCGRIYDKFIEKGLKKQEMEQALELENKYFQLAEELKNIKKNGKELKEKIKFLSQKEDDIYRRSVIETKLEAKNEKIDELKKVNKNWPAVLINLKNAEKDLSAAENQIEQLKEEKEKARKKKSIAEQRKIKDKIDKIEKNISKLEKKIKDLPQIKEDDIERLKFLNDKLIEDKALLKASTWRAEIIEAPNDIQIISGLNDKKSFEKGDIFDVEAYLKIELDDLFVLEVQSKDLDFSLLKERYSKNNQEKNKILKKYEVENLSELQNIRKNINNLNSEIKLQKRNKENILDDKKIEEIEDSQEELEKLKNVRELSEVENELDNILLEKSDLASSVSSLSDKINVWKEKYISHDHIFDEIIELKSEIKKLEEEKEKLEKLPEKYNSISQFKTELDNLRNKKEENENLYQKKQVDYINIKNQLADKSYEELNKEYVQLEAEFKKNVKKAKNLKKVKDIMEEKLKEFDQKSFRPLIESFSYYIKEITGDKYTVQNFDEKYRIKLKSSEKELPVEKNYLSFGTYDSTALALKFALVEQIYSDKRGFFVLDDPLVNLDPDRQKNAFKLIKSLSKKYQIIFTTCSPSTAEKLGGNIIEI